MNKNIVTLVGIFLVGIIAYQAYLLGKLEAEQKTKTEKPEPKITVEIEKPTAPATPTHTSRSVTPANQATHATAAGNEPLIDEKKIKEDFNRLIQDIFGNPKVQAEIQNNISQMQKELEEGMNQFQKELLSMTAEFQKAAKDDPLLSGLMKNFKLPKMLSFHEEGNHYTLTLDVPDNEKSSVDVKVKKGILIVSIHKVTMEKIEENGVLVEKELKEDKQLLVTVPKDADIEKLETKYDNGKLKLILPKKVTA